MSKISTKLSMMFLAMVLISTSCTIKYGFKGGPGPGIKTVSIDYFENQAALANPEFSQLLTESLKDYFASSTNLTLNASDGDIQYSGVVNSYNTNPVAITGNETAALNRLTISVKVSFKNIKEEGKDFESTFSRFADYDSSQSLVDVEQDLMKQIIEQLIQDIFNKSFNDW